MAIKCLMLIYLVAAVAGIEPWQKVPNVNISGGGSSRDRTMAIKCLMLIYLVAAVVEIEPWQ